MQSIAKRLYLVVYLLLSVGPLWAQSTAVPSPGRPLSVKASSVPATPSFSKALLPVSDSAKRPQVPSAKTAEEMKRAMQIQDPKSELKNLGGRIQKKLIDLDESEMKNSQGGQDVSGSKSDISGGETLEAEYLFLAKSLWDRASIQREALEARGMISSKQFELISRILDTGSLDHIHIFAMPQVDGLRSCLPFSVYVDVESWSKTDEIGKERIIVRDLSQLMSRMVVFGAPALTAKQQEDIVNFVSASEDIIHRYDPTAGIALNSKTFVPAMADGNPGKNLWLKIRKTKGILQLVVKDEIAGREKVYSSDPTDVIYNPVTCEAERFPERQNIRYIKKASDLMDTSFFYGSMYSQAKYCTSFLQKNFDGGNLDIESLWVLERGQRLLFCLSYFPVGVRK
jgi:hypothetical protein